MFVYVCTRACMCMQAGMEVRRQTDTHAHADAWCIRFPYRCKSYSFAMSCENPVRRRRKRGLQGFKGSAALEF